MQFLKEKWSYLRNYFVSKIEENKERTVTKYEIYCEQVYKILSWKDNGHTLGIFLLCNFFFWFIVFFEIRPLGILFSSMLILFLWDCYFETQNYSTYHLKYGEAIDDICNCFQEFQTNLYLLKKESPSTFCLGAFIFFLFLSVLTNKIPAYLLMYLILLGIFVIPFLFELLPEEYSTGFKNVLRSVCNIKGVVAEEELIPFIANKDFSPQDVDLDSLLSEKTADSATNSLASGISMMPSYLDVVENQEDIEEEDLMPNRSDSRQTPMSNDFSSDSESDHRDIKFDSTHFHSDSSSDDEKLLTKGLIFTEYRETVTKIPENNLTGMLSNIAIMGSSLLTVALKSNVKTSAEKEPSSSDSEFEIINSEDVRE